MCTIMTFDLVVVTMSWKILSGVWASLMLFLLNYMYMLKHCKLNLQIIYMPNWKFDLI